MNDGQMEAAWTPGSILSLELTAI